MSIGFHIILLITLLIFLLAVYKGIDRLTFLYKTLSIPSNKSEFAASKVLIMDSSSSMDNNDLVLSELPNKTDNGIYYQLEMARKEISRLRAELEQFQQKNKTDEQKPADKITADEKTSGENILELLESSFKMMEHPTITVNNPITVNNQTNPANGNNSATPAEHQKDQLQNPVYNKFEEDLPVKKWKNKALIAFVISFIITGLLVVIYLNQWILDAKSWKWFEKNEVIKGAVILAGVLWDGFFSKLLYDRFYDPTMEDGYRKKLRKGK